MRGLTKISIAAIACMPLTLLAAAPTPVTVKDLMVKIVEPTSNAIFYVARQAPQNDDQWKELQGKALTLVEIANSLTSPKRAKDQKRWLQDAKLLIDTSNAAYTAANAKNQSALEDLNDQLYTACTTCHEHYLPKR
jgi:cytochrome c553